ncbi:MAG: hypothetical protein K0M60_12155, partial [Hydrogenophaga sp.]|nr:hypothetical protein [Hydrogenophaga sp.]
PMASPPSTPKPASAPSTGSSISTRPRPFRPALAAFAALSGLPDSWRNLAERRLRSGKVEDWGSRLNGPKEAIS